MGFIALEKSRRTACCGCLVEVGLKFSSLPDSAERVESSPLSGCNRFPFSSCWGSTILYGPWSLLAKPPMSELRKKTEIDRNVSFNRKIFSPSQKNLLHVSLNKYIRIYTYIYICIRIYMYMYVANCHSIYKNMAVLLRARPSGRLRHI